MMVWGYNISGLFFTPGKQLDKFDIRPGQVVADYGCGPGRYLKRASELVGENGKVYAADVHPLALDYSGKRVERLGLSNVELFLVKNNSSSIPSNSADRIYAIDMFHHINEPDDLLEELFRIAKEGCKLFIEDGYQSREKTILMASSSSMWNVMDQKDKWVMFEPSGK